jgi:hypothetical protein
MSRYLDLLKGEIRENTLPYPPSKPSKPLRHPLLRVLRVTTLCVFPRLKFDRKLHMTNQISTRKTAYEPESGLPSLEAIAPAGSFSPSITD